MPQSNSRRMTVVSAAGVNNTLVAAAPADNFLRLAGGQITNSSAAWRYIKFYDKATAPVAGTDIPILQLGLPPASQLPLGSVFNDAGVSFTAGIGFAITSGNALNNTGVIVANDVTLTLIYS